MQIVDNALAKRAAAGSPIRVGLVGAGFMSKGLVRHLLTSHPGIAVSAISNRTIGKAADAYRFGRSSVEPVTATNQDDLDAAVASSRPVVTDDPFLLTRCESLDVVVDLTGAVELGARVALDAIKHRKHVILMNAEVDATVGPLLKHHADRAGVVVSAADGDQPAVQINLARFVRGLGCIPRVVGNIKGLQDAYRNPTTQQGFAEQWNQNVHMVTSFADGSKVSFEQAIVANALGLSVHRRGMLGRDHAGHVDELTSAYDLDELRELGGVVDYVVGAKPGPGVFCLAEHPDPAQQQYLKLFKLGDGPLYSFYTPYHLCHLELPTTIGRVVDFGDSAGSPLAGPMVEVAAVAKRDLRVGDLLDSYGGYDTYGEATATAEMQSGRYLPEGMVEGCRLRRDIAKDAVVTFDDVDLPPGRVIDRLYAEQRALFG